MAWQFVLTDLAGNVHGEVTQATERKVSLPHLRVPSASFKIPTYHYLANTVLSTDCLVKAYRIYTSPAGVTTRTLAFNGPVISADENGEAGVQSVAVSAAGPMWRLSKRIIPGSKVKATGWSDGSAGSPVDMGQMARNILSNVNAANSNLGYTGIDLGTHTNSVSGFIEKWYLKNAAEAIAELSTAIDSFEYEVAPTEPTDVGRPWPKIGEFNTAPIIGQTRLDAIFEYGTTRANVDSYTRQISRDSILTNAILSVSGWPDGVEKYDHDANTATAMIDKYNLVERPSAAISTRGLFEEVISDAGILDDGLRADLGDYHLLLRDHPREVITFKPSVNAVPVPFIDYEVGDTVRAIAYVAGSLRFNAQFRIWGMSFDIDQNGNENVELEMVAPA